MKLSVLLTLKPTPMIKDLLECMYESIENAVEDYEILFSTADLSEKSIHWMSNWKNARPIDVGNNSSRAHFWNVGFSQIAPDSDLILMFDLDAIMVGTVISKLIYLLESDSKIAAVNPTMNVDNYEYSQHLNLNITSFENLQTEIERFELEHSEEELLTTFLEGNCILIRCSVLGKIYSKYGFIVDERFDLSICDDIDLSVRILLEGFKIKVAATYIHRIIERDKQSFQKSLNLEMAKFKNIWGFVPTYSLLSRNDVLWIVDDLERKGIQILEVGCAAGGSLYMIHDKNPSAELHGIEINSGAAKVASGFAEVENIDVEKIAPEHWKNKFDYILCFDVIEHLIDPWAALENMHAMLKPNGHLIASIPNVAYIGVVQNLMAGYWNYTDAGILDRTHLRFFTANTITSYFNDAGFNIRKMISKQADIPEVQRILIDHFVKIFKIDRKHFETFQYLIDAIKQEA